MADRIDGRRARGDQRKQRIIDAARLLFLERGFRQTPLSAIIARAGGSREMIYTAFGSKAGLLAAIVRQSEEELIASVPDIQSAALPPREVLRHFGANVLAIWRSPQGSGIHRMILAEGLDNPELMQAWFDSGPRPAEVALAAYFARACANGQLRTDAPAQVARLFTFLLMGIAAYPVMAGLEAADSVGIDEAVALVLAACGNEAT